MNIKSLEDKRKLANEKRLQSVKQWQRGFRHKNEIIKTSFKNLDNDLAFPNKRVKFENEVSDSTNTIQNSKPEQEKNPELFESSESEDDEKRFSIKPQFEGVNGQQLLEMSSEFSERFKLDERFRDDDYHEVEKLEEKNMNEPQDEAVNERLRNYEILEQVLGFQVPGKEFINEKKLHRKHQLRFDPEDENVSKYLRKADKKVEKKNQKKVEIKEDDTTAIPISTERYVEISSDLKTILDSTQGQFSLSQKFNSHIEDSVELSKTTEDFPKAFNQHHKQESQRFHTLAPFDRTNEKEQKKIKFFISKDDPRLKEGVEFFMRPRPLEDIREEWTKTRDHVMELFKRKKKIAKRTPSVKSRIIQRQQNSAKRNH